jgi:hypothetical protein
MKRFFPFQVARFRVAAMAALLAFHLAAFAQQLSVPVAESPKPIAPPFPVAPPYPFSPGERLTYEFSFSRFPLSGKLGEIEMRVVTPQEVARETKGAFTPKPEAPIMAFRALAQTKGVIPAVFRLKVRNEYFALAEGRDLGLAFDQKNIEDGKKRKRQHVVFDRPNFTQTVSDVDLNAPTPTPNTRTAEARAWTSDLLTFWYVLRTQPLTPGNVIPMVLSEDGKVYEINVEVTDTVETIKTGVGKFKARQLNIKAYEGKYVRQPGMFVLWIAENAARTPVRVRFKAQGATVTGELVKNRKEEK